MLFAARIGEQSVAPAHMGFAAESPLVGVEANSSALARVSSASPLRLGPAALADFQVWNLAPDTGGWALLGESSTKWVGVSAARFTSVATTAAAAGEPGRLRATLRGVPGERVTVLFAGPSHKDATEVVCTIPSTGTATAEVPAATCA